MKRFDVRLNACPICNSGNIFFYHKDFKSINIYKCKDCSIQFMNPQYSDEYLEEYYSKYTFEEPKWDEPLLYGHDYYLSLVEKFVSNKGKLLDIGCGKGHLLQAAKKRGWQPVGYDVDCDSVEYFSKKYGIKIYCGDFEKIGWEKNSFQLISMHHVFEHLKNPIKYLHIVTSALEQRGIFFIVIPNIRGLSSRIKFRMEKLGIRRTNVGRYYDTSHHLFYYEPKTLSNVLIKQGYKILLIRSGHKVRPNQSMLKRYFLRNFVERITWKSSFLIIAEKL